MAEKKSFLLYTSYLENVEILSNEEAGQLLKAIYAFINGDEIPELDRVVLLTFNPIRSHLERDMEKYKKICRKRSECGAKGGRPKKQMVVDESKSFSEKAKKPDNDNENENVNDNVNENDNDNVNENENVNDNVNENDNDNVNENDNDNVNVNENENEPVHYAENVIMTRKQYDTLCQKYGAEETDRYIPKISRYLAVAADKYPDSYSALCNWLEKGMFSD